jgi:hypothetical protein
MSISRSLVICSAILAASLAPTFAHGGELAHVEVFDRTDGRSLPIYPHDGRLYVAGEPRHQYEVRIHNRTGNRILAVTSVDGVNVINGKTAAENQSGYVVGAEDSARIEGWRKSMDEVATFYFTRLKDSYAARTGRPDNVGVIGVALFREQRPCCADAKAEDRLGAAAPAASAQEAERDSASDRRKESQLGTGHGPRESSAAQYVDFRRAAATADEKIVIYYDSERNLMAQGVLPRNAWFAQRRPEPFPEGFVPDP